MDQRLVYAFQDTQRILWSNEQLCRLTNRAAASTRLFPENYDCTRMVSNYPTLIQVTQETALTAAKRLSKHYQKVCVLNFANGVNPGGGVTYGATGREEDLCRCTNLYPCLMKPELYGDFYGYNNGRGSYYSDRIIYSPGVTVMKTEDEVPAYTSDWYRIDVITCPAPNLNGITVHDYQALEEVYNRRIKNILAVAETYDVQALVLGAFGCDGFANPPELMARAFYRQLTEGEYRHTFREVVFPIDQKTPQDSYNLNVFQKTLCPWQQNPLYNRKVSILGDSFSTFHGMIPYGYSNFYEGDNCIYAGVYSAEDTWWMRTLRALGGQLVVNSSCNGSMVSGLSTLSGNNDSRVYGLYKDREIPDVILVAMGMEDYQYSAALEPTETMYGSQEEYFSASYEKMLWKLRMIYPTTIIYCATLPYGLENGKVSQFFKGGNARGLKLSDYNRVIRECAWKNGCGLVDLEKTCRYDTMDGFHPSGKGMRQLARAWTEALDSSEESYKENQTESIWDWKMITLLGLSGILIILIILLVILLI